MDEKNVQVLLAKRPSGWVQEADLRIVESAIPEMADGKFLIRNHYLSLDPYMRNRMNDAKSYAKSIAQGEVVVCSFSSWRSLCAWRSLRRTKIPVPMEKERTDETRCN